MSQPQVSVVIPTFNSALYIERAMQSVCAQTFDDWELIIVDGTSADDTLERARRFQSRLGDRLVIVEQPNRGCNAARNEGIRLSRGTYVAFLDSDDEFSPRKLERQLELFNRQPDLGLVYCDYAHIDLDGARHESTFDTTLHLAREVPYDEIAPRLCVCSPNFFEYLIQGYFVATITGMVRRDVLADDVRFYERNWYGVCEWLFYLEIASRCRVGFVNEPLCVNHFIPRSISRTSRVRNSIDQRALLRTIRARFRHHTPVADSAIRDQLAYTCRQLGLHSYKSAEYGAAVRYFSESLRERLHPRTGIHMLQSAVRWAVQFGRDGNEPRLRYAVTDKRMNNPSRPNRD